MAHAFSGSARQPGGWAAGSATGSLLVDFCHIIIVTCYDNYGNQVKIHLIDRGTDLNILEFKPDYAPGTVVTVTQHDGSVLRLRKPHPEYDPTDRLTAMDYIQQRHARGEVVTGLLYVDPESSDLHENLNTVETPLNRLSESELCPGSVALEKLNASLR